MVSLLCSCLLVLPGSCTSFFVMAGIYSWEKSSVREGGEEWIPFCSVVSAVTHCSFSVSSGELNSFLTAK